MRKSFTFLASILAVLLCFSFAAFAQRTTGDIQGTVTDPNGAVVPGASVTITGKDVGYTRTVQTDDSGVYRIVQIPPGNYTMTVAATSGFAAQTKENVIIASNNTQTGNFTLSPSSQGVIVDVTGDSAIIDTTETGGKSTITSKQIDDLPKGTGFTSLLKNTVAVRPEPLGGQYTINGATGPENSFLIDGQETQNYKNGLLNTNNDIPYQAVQEIQVKQSGFDAEFGGATGGVVQAITKSGSNDFHGEFGIQFDSAKLDAGPRPVPSLTNSTDVNSAPSISTTGQSFEHYPQTRDGGLSTYPTASLGGSIIKNRLWFFGIHSPRIVQTTRTTNYVQGFGATRKPRVLSPAIIAAGGTTSQTVTEKTTYNYSSFRLDAAPFQSLRLNSSYTWNPIVDESPLLGGSFVNGSPPTATLGGTFYQGADLAALQGGRQNSNNFRAEGIWTPTSKLVANVRFTRGFQNQKLGSYGIAGEPRFICQSVPSAYVAQAGCAQGFSNIGSNDKITRDVSLRQTWDATLTYLFNGFGHHELKGGYQRSSILNDVSTGSVLNAGGYGRAYLYYGQGLSGIDCHFVYVQWKAQCPAGGGLYPVPTLPPGVTVIGSGVNYQFGASGRATDTANSIFIQDKWQPTRRLTLNLGVRMENEAIPAFNDTHIDLKWGWGDKIAPRLGASYDLTGDGKTKVAFQYGKFYDRMKFSLPQGSFGGQFYHVSYFYITSDHPNFSYYSPANLHGTYNWPAGGTCPITPSSPNGYVCDQDYRIASNIPGADVYTNGAVDPDVKPYQQTEYSAEFQREIFRSTVLTARYLHRQLDHVIEDAGIPTDAGEAYVIGNPGEGLAAKVLKDLGYTNVAKPERIYNALQVEMDTRFFKGLSLNLNYTLSRLKGNYSGLANPDELNASGGPRLDPNVSRGFDEPWVGFTAAGGPDNGVLPLDRTHVFKASGAYTFDWWNSKVNATDLGFFYTIESGTPRTTFINAFGIPIPETKRGDLGRTPVFSQTDLNLSHRVKFGRENRFTLAFDVNVINLWNQNTELAYNQNKTSAYWALSETDVAGATDIVSATNILTTRGVLADYAATEPLICANASICGTGVARNLMFGQPIAWQAPRFVRFGFRLFF
jgi:hypothetical protein